MSSEKHCIGRQQRLARARNPSPANESAETRNDNDPMVVDNWSTFVPVTSTEAEVVDNYLGRLIDTLFV